jgi:acetylornithine deacetylase
MKAGLAACMVAVAEAQNLDLSGDVILTAVADEESDSVGMTQVLEHCQADAAIVTEPTQLNIHIAHRGFAIFEVDVIGRASHTSQPHLGANAISHMAKVLTEVEKVQEALNAKSPHPFLGHGLLQAVLIQGGSELFTTPAKCMVTLERRSLPGETQEILEREISALLSRVKGDKPFEVTFRTVLFRDAFETLEDAEIIQTLKNVVQKKGLDVKLEGAPFWMDSALIAAKGIPTVIIGPSGGGMHAVNEWVDIDSVQTCADVLLEVVKEFCK